LGYRIVDEKNKEQAGINEAWNKHERAMSIFRLSIYADRTPS
jgi:hypothetical protein